MKTVKCITVIVSFIFLIISGCKDDSTSTTGPTQQGETNKITLNGAGYNNISVFPYISSGVYNLGSNRTVLVFQCKIDADTVTLLLSFPGQTTGTFPWQTADNYAWFYKSSSSTVYYNSVNSGSTTVTSYGEVGQNIEGNSSGKLNTHSAPYDTISVSCNKISVSRSH